MEQKIIDKLKGSIPESILKELPLVCEKFKINTILRLSHFLSQCSHESANFTVLKENLNYSEAGLLKVFKRYFTKETAKLYAKKPDKIANKVYASRMGNGNEDSGDGYRYSGRGAIQLTGKSNYLAFDKLVDDDIIKEPGLVATKYPLLSAAFFFDTNKLWSICDLGDTDAVVKKLTIRINGGLNGIEDRQEKFDKIYKILNK